MLAPVQRDHHAPPAPKPTTKAVGWSDAETVEKGYKWNADEHDVGKIQRIPLEGLAAGFQGAASMGKLTKESAGGKAIALVPTALKERLANPKTGPDVTVEVVIFLHGYTEQTVDRPYAGYRALDLDKKVKGKQSAYLASLRKGIDDKDVMPVRDVALDEAEKQLEESGRELTIMVLPQGGLTSEFGTAGGREFNADAYAKEVVSRLTQTKYMKTNRAPETLFKGVTMAGHSGAGAALSHMATQAVQQDKERKKAIAAHKQYQPKEAASSALTGDLVLFDAINTSDQMDAFFSWAKMRLETDLTELKDPKKTLDDRRKYLETAPKLRGCWSTLGGYEVAHTNLQHAINQWFIKHASELEPLGVAGCLHANFSAYKEVKVHHEELMRGVKEGDGKKGEGTILAALTALHPKYKECPPLGDLTKPEEMPWPKPKPKVDKGALEEEKKPAAVGH